MNSMNLLDIVVENAMKEDVVEKVKENMSIEELVALKTKLEAELEAAKGDVKMKKNQKPGKAAAGRKYILLDKKLKSWGKVPQQEADIADLLGKNLEVGKEYEEAEVFNVLTAKASEYPSLVNSVQDPTYLFRYYRGLKNDGKRAGLVARNFVRMIG